MRALEDSVCGGVGVAGVWDRTLPYIIAVKSLQVIFTHMPPSDFLTIILPLVIRLPGEIFNDFPLYFFLFGPSPISEPEDQPSQPHHHMGS